MPDTPVTPISPWRGPGQERAGPRDRQEKRPTEWERSKEAARALAEERVRSSPNGAEAWYEDPYDLMRVRRRQRKQEREQRSVREAQAAQPAPPPPRRAPNPARGAAGPMEYVVHEQERRQEE